VAMRQWRAVGLVAVLITSGCSGGSDSAELQALREKVEALEAHYIGVLFNLQVYAMQRAVDSAQHPEVRLGAGGDYGLDPRQVAVELIGLLVPHYWYYPLL